MANLKERIDSLIYKELIKGVTSRKTFKKWAFPSRWAGRPPGIGYVPYFLFSPMYSFGAISLGDIWGRFRGRRVVKSIVEGRTLRRRIFLNEFLSKHPIATWAFAPGARIANWSAGPAYTREITSSFIKLPLRTKLRLYATSPRGVKVLGTTLGIGTGTYLLTKNKNKIL